MADRQGQGRSIKSVVKAFRILEVIREHERLTVTEVSDELDISKSTAYHYLSTLAAEGYVSKEGTDYTLDLSLLTLGGAVREQEELYRRGRNDVARLAEETGEVARLVAEHDEHGIILYQALGENVDEPFVAVGSREPLYCTAAGKAFLAELPPAVVDERISTVDMEPFTENTITDTEQLHTELEAIRDCGVAFDDEERFEGIRCVAKAMSSTSGDLIGAISVSGPTSRLNGDRFEKEIPQKIQNIAGVVEITTKYSNWTKSA